jgi:dihydroorotase
MQVLIKKATIVAPGTSQHLKTRDILLQNGIIEDIAAKLDAPKNATVVEGKNLHVSAGWVDVFANFNDPGLEYKEDLETGVAAAAAGGFTEVFVVPNTQPVIGTKAQVEYVINKNRAAAVKVHPMGTVSKNLEGKDLAEMMDMRNSGAIAFTDGPVPVQNAGLLLKALEYVKAFDGTVIQMPDTTSISKNGLMNESENSTKLGMQGKPALAEELMVYRDAELCRYAESKLHLTAVSTKGSVQMLKKAKKDVPGVSCSVTPYHLTLTDDLLETYDSHYKVNPPLRTKADVTALVKALEEGLIDCFATHHFPHEWDSKAKEFAYTEYGMIGLETAFGLLNKLVNGKFTLEQLITMLSANPRQLFNLAPVTVEKGAVANLTIFDPTAEWTFEKKNIRSRSQNTPFTGTALKGKVVGIYNNKQLILN